MANHRGPVLSLEHRLLYDVAFRVDEQPGADRTPALGSRRLRTGGDVTVVATSIMVLEAMRAGGELPLRLEAERCRELAAAWERKGQRAYADDYRDRARLHAI